MNIDKPESLADLAELELTEGEQLLNIWNEYYPHERANALRDIREYAERRFRPIVGKKNLLEKITGFKINIKIPRKVIRLPDEKE